ncbi:MULTISPECIES: hypothetical protein [Streptomyces]|uniref:Uncharacterized protein n=3 Tax=Streptomyces TaxID=1883 RepID=A0A8H9LWR6_9ACTN|nr:MULTISPECIES: hypothetical protein [Streptomyces]MBL3806082.1 hypothetical protein [Streptomyces sp. BRB081]MDQ0294356.1 hypothetical protein [Streptomyces sp. DSM 41037]RPK91109.1 hypothetical protein EES47_07055 [Streptomyces sp. ADI98-12]WPR51707.1 hypothetical protein SJI45_12295 [Streptomyces sp. S399]WSU37207.1 hypothetical protein OG378_16180 [Streptomyces gougerotii]
MSSATLSAPRSDGAATSSRTLIIEDLETLPEHGTALFTICIAASPAAPGPATREQHQA